MIIQKRLTLGLGILLVATLMLTTPGTATALDSGRVVKANLSGEIIVERQDNSQTIITYEDTLLALQNGNNIVIDVIGAGIVAGTGEEVGFEFASAGQVSRQGTQLHLDTTGLFTIQWADGSQSLVDVISTGFIQQQGQDIVINLVSAGVIVGSGENIVIDVIDAGVLTK